MSDVLTITVPTPAQYPSVNTMWATKARSGKKTASYHELFDAVYEAAQAEMARTGWETAEYFVETKFVLYCKTAVAPDPGNVAKCEADALTAAKIWSDDKLGRPHNVDIEYDPNGVGRVVIILRRRFPPYVAKVSAMAGKMRKRIAGTDLHLEVTPPPVIAAKPAKVVWVNGVATDYDEAMRDLKVSMARGGKR